ncbi:MarR family winged helix-turn-helix transcriptional regulator [Jiulongibacter sediminis]|jgi:DNA-binding MarR family transcriptional regulator|uniref:MarR family winged helix-turn-helix transcriptional regulator n=1 Tax=Jiulongibacter sediminis TaxID=1605367 RepID=UPI0026E953E0|nr:MarR family winged helix-turn-helix transcriptional regulator [Jiulongibacter sediminis]
MENSVFNPGQQQKSLSGKIVASFERISEVFKVLLWEKAKLSGLSPIQIQLLIFIAYHSPELCNVSHLAKEFNVTKPTISDAIKILTQKALIQKFPSVSDSRSYTIGLTEAGKTVVDEKGDFTQPLEKQVEKLSITEQTTLFSQLSSIIFELQQNQILSVQRTCYGCRYFSKQNEQPFCKLLNSPLAQQDIRIDCPEFEPSV